MYFYFLTKINYQLIIIFKKLTTKIILIFSSPTKHNFGKLEVVRVSRSLKILATQSTYLHRSSEIALKKKVRYKVSLCENYQRQSCKAFIGLTNRAKMIGGGATPYTWNFGSNWPRWSDIAKFLSIFVRSASAVTLIESRLRAFQWVQDEHRTLSLSPR